MQVIIYGCSISRTAMSSRIEKVNTKAAVRPQLYVDFVTAETSADGSEWLQDIVAY